MVRHNWLITDGFTSRGSESAITTIASIINSNLSIATSSHSPTSRSSIPRVSDASRTSSFASSSCSATRPSSASAIRSTTSSDQKRNHEEISPNRISRDFSSSSGHQGKSSSHHSGSDQRRPSTSSIRGRVTPRSHSSGVVSRGSRDIQQIRSRKQSQKSSSKSVLKVTMPMILFFLVISVKKNVDQLLSQMVIGPRPGSKLKGCCCAKGFKQVTSGHDKYALTPQATTLKLILLMSQPHSWKIAVSDIASAFLNTL